MKKKIFHLLLTGSMALFVTSCQKTFDKPFVPEYPSSTNNSKATESNKKVYVSTLDELYSAVNNPDNAGNEVVIAPGTYVLNASYPNGGRLELQTDMSLKGQPGNSDAVLIDESALPNSSFFFTPTMATGGIRLGRGTNNLEWLSVKGANASANPFSAIETDLPSSETHIGIYHIKVYGNGNRIGIMLRNRLAEHAGRKIFAQLEDNEISGLISSFGFGISVQNVNSASGSLIKIDMRNNYIHGNKIGVIVANGATTANNTTENSSIEINSYADRIEGNGCGIDPSGASSGNATSFANDNAVTIKMHGSSIRDNNPPNTPVLQPVNGALPGAVYAAGGYSSINNTGGNNKTSRNTLKLEFWGCDISNNNGTDIYAIGAWCNPAAILAGTNNLVEIYLHGLSANATVDAVASIPAEAAGTNVVNVYR